MTSNILKLFNSHITLSVEFNDRIFDTNQITTIVFTSEEKKVLEQNKLSYSESMTFTRPMHLTGDLIVTQLLEFMPRTLAKQLDNAFQKARSIMAAEEWELCKELKNHLGTIHTPRNAIQHPRLG